MSTPTHPTPPTAAPCVECGTTGGYVQPHMVRPWRARGLCSVCYARHWHAETLATFADQLTPETFEGFPPGYTHAPTGWPVVPALVAPLHPPLPAPDRWVNALWFRRPQHDPVGQRLFDAETRRADAEAA